MNSRTWAEKLWGQQAKLVYLVIATCVLLLTCLGARDIWTQEHRWADIVTGMFFRHDFLHPYLGEVNYYDKPLLSYWLIALLSYCHGSVSAWTLRLPSALAGILSIWSIYKLGSTLKNKQLGLLSGWMLLTTFYFVFWARTSSADMLNLGGTLFAVAWYFTKKEQVSFFNYAVFFLIIAVTSLCKGLVGAIVPVLAILPDLLMKQTWKKHLRWSFVLAMIPAACVYVLPFWASSHFGGSQYAESGLYLVYRENILRYFQPFDHKGPIYTYLIYLPVYLFPWTFFFFPALTAIYARWRQMTDASKWMHWAVLVLFVFFTLSGSRRNYYVLPIVPFAILLTADWIMSGVKEAKKSLCAGVCAIGFFAALVIWFDVAQPLYYADGGVTQFAADLKAKASQSKPWAAWQVILLDPEVKVGFYLQLPPTTRNYSVQGSRETQTTAALLQVWPVLSQPLANTIFISRELYLPLLKPLLPKYQLVEAKPSLGERLLGIKNENNPIAFIPLS
jgi:4-amino-4-deoxy-L-arabinose transferase-like glycosyltransferase